MSNGDDAFHEIFLDIFSDEETKKCTENVLHFNHKNLRILGFQKYSSVLNWLSKSKISVVCSRWDEPFGRTSLEASSRGVAVIISNKGGLPETAKNAVILNTLNSQNLYRAIDNLIKDKTKLINLQKKNYNDFIFTHKYIANIIDNFDKK